MSGFFDRSASPQRPGKHRRGARSVQPSVVRAGVACAVLLVLVIGLLAAIMQSTVTAAAPEDPTPTTGQEAAGPAAQLD
ncbi:MULTISPECIES: hypothetical protein [Nocardioides]|uniref:Uncharacterized protein n=1 Tax=Nocardioides vastitatis TaxID=2568655 RepID=A0ABW0ZJU8_9ACTN|nr:hypothetical protein [Nocardioides sp.]THJ08754.1 hypothetical protein E7Z54_03820 [Nocardioides sp.]